MTIYKPYTYLIGWTKIGQYYYGVRYAKGCHPDDFWKEYFTSSQYVSDLRKSFGEPDVIQIRKTFDTAEKAIEWENKVIRRLALHKQENFLNRCAYPAMSPEVMKTRQGTKGMTLGPMSESHKKKLSEIRKGKKKPEGFLKGNQNTKGKSWYTDGVNNLMLSPEDSIPDGFTKGRTYKSTEKMGRKKGKTMSEESKSKMSKSRTGYVWINNGKDERKHKKDADIPKGWQPGRSPSMAEHCRKTHH